MRRYIYICILWLCFLRKQLITFACGNHQALVPALHFVLVVCGDSEDVDTAPQLWR